MAKVHGHYLAPALDLELALALAPALEIVIALALEPEHELEIAIALAIEIELLMHYNCSAMSVISLYSPLTAQSRQPHLWDHHFHHCC